MLSISKYFLLQKRLNFWLPSIITFFLKWLNPRKVLKIMKLLHQRKTVPLLSLQFTICLHFLRNFFYLEWIFFFHLQNCEVWNTKHLNCRLQPVLNTRMKQMQSWCDLILDFARYHKLYHLNVVEAVATSPLFNNNKIQRTRALTKLFCWDFCLERNSLIECGLCFFKENSLWRLHVCF